MKYNGAALLNLIGHSCSSNTFKFHLRQYIEQFNVLTIFRICYFRECIQTFWDFSRSLEFANFLFSLNSLICSPREN